MDYFLVVGILIAVSFFLGLFLARRRGDFSNSYVDLLVGTTVLSPLMVGGFTWYEEFFLGGYLVVKYFSQIKANRNSPRIKFGVTHILLLYLFLELAFGFYFFYQNGEIAFRKVRWVVFLILIYGVISEAKKEWKSSSLQKIHLQVILIFTSVYFFWNQITIWKTGSAAYAQYAQVPARGTREAIWANTAYVTPSILICIAFAIICMLHSELKSIQIYSILIIIFCVLGQATALSRSGILLIFLCIGGASLAANSRKKAKTYSFLVFLTVCSTIFGLLLAGPGMLSGFLFDIKTTITIPFNTNIETNRESDRLLQFRDAYRVIREGTPTEALIRTLFGYGLRTSGLVLQKTEIVLSRDSYAMSLVPNLLIEIGVVGVLLFMFFFLMGMSTIYRNNSPYKLFQVMLAFGIVSSTLIVNNFDMIPLYLFFIYSQGFVLMSKLAKE
jgi:hypothetical protein